MSDIEIPEASSVRNFRKLGISSNQQLLMWIAAFVALIAIVSWLSSRLLDNAVEKAVHNSAVATSERWATFFGENMPQIEQVLAGNVNEEQEDFVRTVEKMGDVFRFKLFAKDATLVFISDELEKLNSSAGAKPEEEPHAKNVVLSGLPNVEVVRDHNKANRPPIYAEAYVPIKNTSGFIIGVAEVYVNQTAAEQQMRSSFYGIGFTLAAIAGLAVAIPGAAFLWRSRQALAASRKIAEIESENLKLEKEQSAGLSAHNDSLVDLNKELAQRMKELRAAQDELVSKGRMEQLGQLTATVAHELRNPLGSVRTSAYLLERKIKDKGLNVETQLERINKGVVRCDNIITQLLDFSRSKQLQTTPSDLDQWLVGVLEDEAKKLPAVVAISCELGLAGREIPFDPSRLQRAIVNLVSNAAEALVGQGDDPSKFANAEPAIKIETKLEGEFVKLSVLDNGPGIAPDILQRIREPLFTTKSFGTGLGVPAIEQIANQHGGHLDIASEVGHGAKFSLFLPMNAVNEEPAAAAA